MNILSLFDGIGCGYVALERAGIKIDEYYASEIEKSSITIARKNHPNIIEIGDVSKIHYNNGVLHTENGDFRVGHIDLLMGGSPCTDFSTIGSATGMKTGETEVVSLEQYLKLKAQGLQFSGQSYLFWEYARLLHEVQPSYFLLENVVMAKKWQKIIDDTVGVSPLKINSSLVSAQNRPRLYWTNIKNVEPPEDRRIVLDDILDAHASMEDVSHCLTVQRSFVRLMDKYGYIPQKFNPYNASEIKNKACALSQGSMVTSSCATLIFVKTKDGVHTVDGGLLNGKYPVKLRKGEYNIRKLTLLEQERLQTLPDNYTAVDGVGYGKRSSAIGNGWTVDAIAHILMHVREA